MAPSESAHPTHGYWHLALEAYSPCERKALLVSKGREKREELHLDLSVRYISVTHRYLDIFKHVCIHFW